MRGVVGRGIIGHGVAHSVYHSVVRRHCKDSIEGKTPIIGALIDSIFRAGRLTSMFALTGYVLPFPNSTMRMMIAAKRENTLGQITWHRIPAMTGKPTIHVSGARHQPETAALVMTSASIMDMAMVIDKVVSRVISLVLILKKTSPTTVHSGDRCGTRYGHSGTYHRRSAQTERSNRVSGTHTHRQDRSATQTLGIAA